MDWDGLKRDWRIWIWAIFMLASLALIVNPTNPYIEGDDGQLKLNTNIKQGLDLKGGARVLIDPQGDNLTQDTLDQMKSTLRTRISAFGLQEMDIRQVTIGNEAFIQIELAGSSSEDLTELINRTGRFEAHIPIFVSGERSVTLGTETYDMIHSDDAVSIGDDTYRIGDRFTLSSGRHDIEVIYTNNTDRGAKLSAIAITGADIIGVDVNPQASGVTCSNQGCQFQFQVSVEGSAAEKVKDIVQAFPKGISGGNLQGAQLELYLDESLISSLNIGNEFKDTLVQQPVVTGGAETRQAAVDESKELKSVLRSGALPVPIEIVSTNTISATLGAQFLQTAILAILIAILAVAGVVYLRYRDAAIVIPLTMTGFSELVMIFGFAAMVGWTIDLPSIAGIIAAIGTGVDDQIIITDERGKERVKSMKERFKRAFFIIFTSAASTIGAMFPLTQIGAGAIQGFALTTIAGVIIGVLITRPAYARVLQHMDK